MVFVVCKFVCCVVFVCELIGFWLRYVLGGFGWDLSCTWFCPVAHVGCVYGYVGFGLLCFRCMESYLLRWLYLL